MAGTAEGNNPNINPADNDTLAGLMRFAFKQLLRDTAGMLPAKVLKYDRAANRVQVQLLIAMITTSGAQVERAQIANIPVLNLGGGGFILNFPIAEGDIGFILANDRDISLFLQTEKEAAPNTNRIKSFSDGIFIPSVLSNYDVSSDAGNVTLQNLDGTVKVTLSPTTVTLSSQTEIVLDSPLTTVTGDLVADGLTRSTGGLSVTGTATTGAQAYSAYFGGPIYASVGGDTDGAFRPGVPSAPIPPPPPP